MISPVGGLSSSAVQRWSLVVPVKRLTAAKSRLAPLAPQVRADLALAFALDTVEAALLAAGVVQVVAVTDEPRATEALSLLGARVVPDLPRNGLNAALVHGAREALLAASTRVAAMSADLPCLRGSDLGDALASAIFHRSAFVADISGSGTTLLAAASLAEFSPQFGPGSARRHRDGGARPLEAVSPRVRTDVDTLADLHAALMLGAGPRTVAVAAAAGLAAA